LGSALGVPTYSGACMRVRRDSDNVEADVGFDSNDELSLTSPISNTSDAQSYTDFADFVDHTGTPANAFVRKWYDQSSNTNDAEQSTAGSQPKIYDSSTGLITENGKPKILANDGDATLILSIASNVGYDFYSVSRIETSDALFLGYEGLANRFAIAAGSGGAYKSSEITVNSSRRNGNSYTFTTRTQIHTDFSSQHLMYVDMDLDSAATGNLTLGYVHGGGFAMWSAQELIIYPNTVTHTPSDLETDINDYYQIPGM